MFSLLVSPSVSVSHGKKRSRRKQQLKKKTDKSTKPCTVIYDMIMLLYVFIVFFFSVNCKFFVWLRRFQPDKPGLLFSSSGETNRLAQASYIPLFTWAGQIVCLFFSFFPGPDICLDKMLPARSTRFIWVKSSGSDKRDWRTGLRGLWGLRDSLINYLTFFMNRSVRWK